MSIRTFFTGRLVYVCMYLNHCSLEQVKHLLPGHHPGVLQVIYAKADYSKRERERLEVTLPNPESLSNQMKTVANTTVSE